MRRDTADRRWENGDVRTETGEGGQKEGQGDAKGVQMETKGGQEGPSETNGRPRGGPEDAGGGPDGLPLGRGGVVKGSYPVSGESSAGRAEEAGRGRGALFRGTAGIKFASKYFLVKFYYKIIAFKFYKYWSLYYYYALYTPVLE